MRQNSQAQSLAHFGLLWPTSAYFGLLWPTLGWPPLVSIIRHHCFLLCRTFFLLKLHCIKDTSVSPGSMKNFGDFCRLQGNTLRLVAVFFLASFAHRHQGLQTETTGESCTYKTALHFLGNKRWNSTDSWFYFFFFGQLVHINCIIFIGKIDS